MKMITLTADGNEKEFTLPRAQAILVHQIKAKCINCWSIVGSDYEFNGAEINGVSKSTKSLDRKAKSVGDSTSKDAAK